MVEWFAGYASVDNYVQEYEEGDDDSDVGHDEDYGEKKNYCLTLMINGYDHEYSEYDDEMQMQIKSLWVFWIELKLNDGDAEYWLFKADMLDFVVETFIEHQLIDTFKEN